MRIDAIDKAYAKALLLWRNRNVGTRDELADTLEGFRIRYAYNSGLIENPRITYHDTRSVFEDGRAVGYTGDIRTLFEIQNLKECHELMLDAYAEHKPLTENLVLLFHRTLTQGAYDEHRWKHGERPGEYKRGNYVVGPRQSGCPPENVQREIASLFGELDAATPENVLTAAAYFHLVFEAIHPFADGNGRCGRALMNYLLILMNHPPIIIFNEDRMAYYGAIEVWDAEQDLAPMCAFLKAETVKTWT